MAINATLALLLRLTSSGTPLSDYWTGVGCATLLAVRHFNARDGAVVPKLQELSSPLQLRELVLNTDSVQSGGIAAYRSALEAVVHGIIGPSRSAVSSPTAQLGGLDKIPQLSHWSSSPSLSDKGIYSHFGRTYPSDALTGELIMQTVSSFGWKKVGCIYINDLYAQGLVSVMNSWSITHPDGAKIAAASSFSYDDVSSVQRAVKDVAATGLNIIIFIGFDGDLDATLSAADEAGMLGAEYVWMFSDTTTADSPANTPNPALTAQRLAGSISLSIAPSQSEGYRSLAAVWSELTPADCANDLFNATAETFSKPPPDVGAFGYDAVIALGLGLAAAHADGIALSDGDATLARIWAQTFSGASGTVQFSETTGDREYAGLTYSLWDFKLQPNGEIVQTVVGTIGAEGVSFDGFDPIVWRGGTTDVPDDLTTVSRICPSGHVEAELSVGTRICEQCPMGKYEVQRKLCMDADSMSYVPFDGANETGIRSCQLASPGTRVLELAAERHEGLGVHMQPRKGATGSSECVCDFGWYNAELLGDPDYAGVPRCEPCQRGAICAGGQLLPVAKPGFAQLAYANPTKPTLFLECEGQAPACPGGSIEPIALSDSAEAGSEGTITVTRLPYRCGDGYLNGTSACYRCEEGYAMQAGRCETCDMASSAYLVINLVFVLVWFPVLREVLINYVKSCYTSIAFVQFLGVYAKFPLPWGPNLASLFTALGSFNLNLDALHVACSAGSGGLAYRDLWVIQMLLPLLYPLAVVVHLTIGRMLSWLAATGLPPTRLLIRSGWRPRRDYSVAQLVSTYLPTGLFFLNLYLMMGLSTSLEIFACQDDGNGVFYLRADPGIECWKGEHVTLAAFAGLGVALYLGVIPAIYCWVLFYVLPRRGRKNKTAKAFRFIYERFDADYAWWELIEMGRKVIFVLVSTFGQGNGLRQSVGALAAVVVVLVTDMLYHPYVNDLYDVLEEVLCFVEFMVLLLGIVALVQPEVGGWHEITAWVLLIAAFALIAYVAIVDIDSAWQRTRAGRLRKRLKLTLSACIWEVGAFDSLLLDWLELAPPAEVLNFRALEADLMRGLYSDAFEPTKLTKQYEKQLSALPFLFNNLCGRADGSLKTRTPARPLAESGVHVATVDELLSSYLNFVSGQPFGGSEMPMHSLFEHSVRGALCSWLAKAKQSETRKELHRFLEDIMAFAKKQKMRLPLSLRLKKRFLIDSTGRATADSNRAALLNATEQGEPESVRTQSGRIHEKVSVKQIIGDTNAVESGITLLLERLLTQLRCEMAEVIVAPTAGGAKSDPSKGELASAVAVHASAQFVRRKRNGRAVWSTAESTPVGLCTSTGEAVYVVDGYFTCGQKEGRLDLPYDVGEISQLCVPIFEYKRVDMTQTLALAKGVASETSDERKLLGVLRCVNKFADNSSRAGLAFLEADAETVGLFASLVAELGHQRVYEWQMVTLLQRTARWKLRARKISASRKTGSVHPS